MSDTLFTVIIASFNHKPFVERSICSVIDQPIEDVQCIVVDRGSADGSLDVINLYKNEIDRVIRKPNATTSEAINSALKIADGQYICVLHADEVLEPDTLHRVAQIIDDENSPAWISGGCVCVDPFEYERGHIYPQTPRSLAQLLMREAGHFASASTFFAGELIEEVGLLNENLNQAYMYDLWCRFVAENYMPYVTSDVLAVRHENAHKQSADCILEQGRELIDIAEQYTEKLPMAQRYALWSNCDQRRRIYALAEAEAKSGEAKTYMLRELLRHPWWLADSAVRHTVMHGVDHPLPTDALGTPGTPDAPGSTGPIAA